jgi:hypothetical protein
MSFSRPLTYEEPGVPIGAQWVFQVAVKTFEANTVALLEGAINVWLLSLQTNPLDHVVLAVNYQSGAKEKALVTYGAYVNINNT